MHKRRKQQPYWTLSRSKRRDNYIRLRQKIRNDSSVYGGLFTSHQLTNRDVQRFITSGLTSAFWAATG